MGESTWELDDVLVGSLSVMSGLPVEFGIRSAYPNPFNATIQLSYGLSEAGKVGLEVYDVSGREVVTLIDGEISAGLHSLNWDASGMATGLYFARLEQYGQIATMKLLLVK